MTVGEILREARESRGVSLEVAERETKIRQKYLAALEDDNLAALPGPLYARGFLRNYSSFLGLDPDEIIHLYDSQSTPTRTKIRAARGEPVTGGKSGPPGAEKINIQPLSPDPIDTRVRYGSSYVAISLLAIPLIIAFYFIYSAYAGGRGELVSSPTATARPPTPVSAVPSGVPLTTTNIISLTLSPTVPLTSSPVLTPSGTTPAGTAAAAGTPSAAQTIPAAAKVTLQVTTVRDAWMQITVDGVQQFNGTLAKDKTKEWTGDSTIRMRTGRADSVQITVNGADLGLLGDRNHLIVEKEWDKSGNEKVIKW